MCHGGRCFQGSLQSLQKIPPTPAPIVVVAARQSERRFYPHTGDNDDASKFGAPNVNEVGRKVGRKGEERGASVYPNIS